MYNQQLKVSLTRDMQTELERAGTISLSAVSHLPPYLTGDGVHIEEPANELQGCEPDVFIIARSLGFWGRIRRGSGGRRVSASAG